MQINHDVTPDSMLILHAAEEVCAEEGFDELLEGVRDRVDEIESLHRTRELTVRFSGMCWTKWSAVFSMAHANSLMPLQFKDVDKGDRIRLSVDKGGARRV